MSAEAALTREQVISIYREVLGRTPRDDEIAHQLATLPTLGALLRVALDSDEYAARLEAEQGLRPVREAPTVVNVFHPDLAEWGHRVGTVSEDRTAVVGHEGWLFLSGGSNANLSQFVGAAPMDDDWLERWCEVMRRREAEVRALGAVSALVVVPDKLAVYEERYPERLQRVGPRPVERLLAVEEAQLVYPLAQLRAAARQELVYLRTDTHLSFRGNELLFDAVRDPLRISARLDLSELPLHAYLTPGDLGAKFDPSILDVVRSPGTLHRARITEDNRDEIAAVDGHIGIRRVFVNDAAEDDRVAVIFGDSFGFGSEAYQGLSWFLAQVFRETHFVWVPFGWDPDYARAIDAEVVVMQGAERFVARVPHLAIEVARLAEETLSRKRALDVDSAFNG